MGEREKSNGETGGGGGRRKIESDMQMRAGVTAGRHKRVNILGTYTHTVVGGDEETRVYIRWGTE